jgi:lysine-specific demethylase/histidyl-hydroxylase NO66
MLEGCQHWRVYAPVQKLPRQDSNPLTEEEMNHRKPVIDVELSPGDMLYIPRGWIYQANTVHGGKPTLFLSLHTMRHWSWCDFLELLIPDALEAVTESETSTLLRQGLPRNFLNYMGVMHEYRDDQDLPEGLRQVAQNLDPNESAKSDRDEEDMKQLRQVQDTFKAEARKRIMRICKEALDMITAGCDQMAKRFLSERLPPVLSHSEVTKRETVKIRAPTMVRCIRKGAARIVLEDGKAILYHCMDNAREFQAEPLSPLEFEVDDGPALEALLTTTYPHWICVQDLNHGTIEDKIEIAQALYDEGILEVH